MTTTIVVPCYNEERRLDATKVHALAEGHHVLLVNDGSTDNTANLIDTIAHQHADVSVLHLPQNCGKAEAVRQGLLAALTAGATIVAFTDADFATSPAEVHRLIARCLDEQRPLVIGSRVELMGHHVQRSGFRHYTGRVFATATSLVLGFPVYDTQCGAKVFTDSPALRAALAQPFVGRWSFDVELIGRLAADTGPEGFLEVPLLEWHDVAGSKLSFADSLGAAFELLSVRRALATYRRGRR